MKEAKSENERETDRIEIKLNRNEGELTILYLWCQAGANLTQLLCINV